MILIFLSWNVSASSHMTSVTKRNTLDPMGDVGGCSYTPHNYHVVGWIFLPRPKRLFVSFCRCSPNNTFRCVFNHHQLPRWASTQHNCAPLTFPTPRTSPTLVAEKYFIPLLGERPKSAQMCLKNINNNAKHSAKCVIPIFNPLHHTWDFFCTSQGPKLLVWPQTAL